ncbi:MAG: hypothetical protein LBG27_03215, partial [Spirochaetaceae bacterium]|nr:hypothetical protein [Spirochaetaceae bacterium]
FYYEKEEQMKKICVRRVKMKKGFLHGIIGLLLVIGFVFADCDTGGGGGGSARENDWRLLVF